MEKRIIVETMAMLFDIVEESDIVSRIRKGGKVLLNANKLGIRDEIYTYLSELETEDNRRIRKWYYIRINEILTKMYMAA